MSLRTRLLLALISAVLVTSLIASGATYYWARREIDEIFDYQLKQQALALRDQAFLPGSMLEAEPDPEQHIVIQVWDVRGTRLYVSHRAAPLPRISELGYSNLTAQGEDWRVYSFALGPEVIQVAQPLRVRRAMATNAGLRILLPFMAVLPLLAGMIWWLVGRGLRPLNALADTIANRDAQTLTPIATTALPEEARPMVVALNQLLQRLSDALQVQKQFTADAAHELRTPLTALTLQTQLLARAETGADRAEAIQALREGVARSTHLVERMLTLARLDPEGIKQTFAMVALDKLAASAVHELTAIAAGKGVLLTSNTDKPVLMLGHEGSLHSLLTNLVDNAVRHTPAGGRVEVLVAEHGGRPLLEVSDTGPGIPREERARVFDRFYRVAGAEGQGSGLGLAIIKRVADLHQAEVVLADNPTARGLCVRVIFPPPAATIAREA